MSSHWSTCAVGIAPVQVPPSTAAKDVTAKLGTCCWQARLGSSKNFSACQAPQAPYLASSQRIRAIQRLRGLSSAADVAEDARQAAQLLPAKPDGQAAD
jgi:hypothetical protein